MRTVEEVIADINAVGYKVNNLFQRDGGWQANLVDASGLGHAFSFAPTPADALERVLSGVKMNEGGLLQIVETKPHKGSIFD